jgi:hypothetical protein
MNSVTTPQPSRGIPWLVAGLIVAALGIFVLPWFVPMHYRRWLQEPH